MRRLFTSRQAEPRYINPRLGRSCGQEGATVVEIVILLPVIMVVLIVSVQAALWVLAANVVDDAAARGEEVAAAAGSNPAAGQAAAQAMVSRESSLVSNSSVTVGEYPGDFIESRVEADAESIIPGIHLHVSAVRNGPVQEFRGSG